MWATPVVLLGMFLAVEGNGLMSLFSKKRTTDDFHCFQEFGECKANLRHYEGEFNDLGRLHEFLQADYIDQVCRDLRTLKSCNDDILTAPECDMPYITEQTTLEAALADYICKDNTKRLLVAMSESPCVRNPGLLFQLNYDLVACTQRVQDSAEFGPPEGEFSQVCLIEERVKPCAVEAARKFCGDSLVALGLDAWDAYKRVMMPPADCSSQGPAPRLAKKGVFFNLF